jgi:hypothetical protein
MAERIEQLLIEQLLFEKALETSSLCAKIKSASPVSALLHNAY